MECISRLNGLDHADGGSSWNRQCSAVKTEASSQFLQWNIEIPNLLTNLERRNYYITLQMESKVGGTESRRTSLCQEKHYIKMQGTNDS